MDRSVDEAQHILCLKSLFGPERERGTAYPVLEELVWTGARTGHSEAVVRWRRSLDMARVRGHMVYGGAGRRMMQDVT